MPDYEGEGEGKPLGDGVAIGISAESVDNAIRAAVHAANQPHGTWFVVSSVMVQSVNDPNVGGYKVVITPGG